MRVSLGYRYQGDLLSRAPTMNAWGKPTARAEHAGAGVRRIYEGVPLCRTGRGSRTLYGQCISRWVLRTVRKIVGHMTAPVRI